MTVPTLTLPAALPSVRVARSFVLQECARSQLPTVLCDEATLLASELVTNAVLHGRSELRIEVECRAGVVRVTVHDENSRRPVLVQDDPDALDGRGLAIVVALAARWGVEDERAGKAVWFELAVG